ncbi:HisA/HisF-related TIM barrel protein [Bailinhaonella thermotolerans]|uniref:Imidazole glycerol phosphate synthase subunit HisF n=1 Tax=Bailinhaonella thermotolerans TaxID=1070861 RepID=A0A3A4A8J9_9ACTN|nr:HisA/HisF-related TIM barrel protein [Bailinhaonella thermotolerans]RJL23257.1 imidazole glycerol phosphate synthase subunit HisF [Bailinhaonella thermotolerans]
MDQEARTGRAPIVPCLEVRGGRTIEPSGIPGLSDPRDPVEITETYRRQGAAAVILDIAYDGDEHGRLLRILPRLAAAAPRLWVTFADGRAPSAAAAEAILAAGAEAIGFGTTAVEDPPFVRELAARHGSERILGTLDVRRAGPGRWDVVTHGGARSSGLDAVSWAGVLAGLGAGTLLPNSLDGEEAGAGYDLPLYRAIAGVVDLPLIASGGGARPEHLCEGLKQPNVRFAVVNKATHTGAMSIAQAHAYLRDRGLG